MAHRDVQVFGEPLHPAKLWRVSMGRAGTAAGDSPCRASAPTPTPSCTRHQIVHLDAQRHRRTPEMKNQPLAAVSASKTNTVAAMAMLSKSATAVLIQAKGCEVDKCGGCQRGEVARQTKAEGGREADEGGDDSRG